VKVETPFVTAITFIGLHRHLIEQPEDKKIDIPSNKVSDTGSIMANKLEGPMAIQLSDLATAMNNTLPML
jgi:hypothetical protein